MEIKDVIICGLGALGLTYANKLKNVCNLYILADEERVQKYKKKPPTFNDKITKLNYITPDDLIGADLIIIATKSNGLDDAIKYINNFVCENTIIISLINGISSEEKISKTYPDAKVLRSYFIGHSAMGVTIGGERKFYQDGVGKIVFEPYDDLENFFRENNIDYGPLEESDLTKKTTYKTTFIKNAFCKCFVALDINLFNLFSYRTFRINGQLYWCCVSLIRRNCNFFCIDLCRDCTSHVFCQRTTSRIEPKIDHIVKLNTIICTVYTCIIAI